MRAYRTLVSILVGLSLLLGASPQVPVAHAAIQGLDLVRDTRGVETSGTADVGHDLYFVLPTDAQQVIPTDYILIDFPHYHNVRPATTIVGGFGTPVIDVVGTTIRVTGMSILPGGTFAAQGILADNPASGQSEAVVISIADDGAGLSIRNQETTVPVFFGGYTTVSATVETILSSLSLSGYTGAGVFVTMMEAGAVIGTTQSSGTGFFNFTLYGMNPGDHTFTIFSTDSDLLTTAVTTMNLYLIPSTTTTVTGVLLSPTISISTFTIHPGDPITVSGTGRPNSQINIFLESPLRSYTATVSNAGAWSFIITSGETQSLLPGAYRVYVNDQDGIGNQSIASPTVNFTVQSDDVGNPAPCGDISHGDLNCDGKTNLTDFSILLFHWQTNHRAADINSDKKVNLTDFSIMMFYFNR